MNTLEGCVSPGGLPNLIAEILYPIPDLVRFLPERDSLGWEERLRTEATTERVPHISTR